MDAQEPLLEALAQVRRDLSDPDARSVRGHDAVRRHDFFHPREEILFDLEVFDDGFDDEVHSGEPAEVVLEVAGLDHGGVSLRVEARRFGLGRSLEPPLGETVLGGYDVEEQALDPRIGQLGGNVRPHDPRA